MDDPIREGDHRTAKECRGCPNKGAGKNQTATGACQSPSITVHGECEDRMDDKRGARKMQTRQPQEEWQLKSWNGGSRLGVCVCVKRVSFLGQAQPVLRLLQLQE